jgi:hypothetical protein
MSHHDGHEHGESEQAQHGDNGHEHDHPSAGGHDPHAGVEDVIPESSLQDKLLMLLSGLCLAGLLYFGSLWAFSLTVPTHAGHGQGSEGESHAAPATVDGE